MRKTNLEAKEQRGIRRTRKRQEQAAGAHRFGTDAEQASVPLSYLCFIGINRWRICLENSLAKACE
jgi:hypothetical protein